MPWPENGVDHLDHAVALLATGTGTLQQRLDQAWLVLQSLDDRCFRRAADTAAWDRIKAAVATSRLVLDLTPGRRAISALPWHVNVRVFVSG